MKKIKKKIKEKIWEVFDIERIVEMRLKKLLKNENLTPINSFDKKDIFIASYPKSGVTWMQNLITCMLLNTNSKYITPKLVSEIVPDTHAKRFYKRTFFRMFFKTHSLPKSEYKKVIHLVRDGRDTLVSFYYYLQLNKDSGPTLSEMVDLEQDIWPQKWYEHTKAWSENPYSCELLTIRYEDLKEKPLETLRKIADFSDLQIEEEKLQEIFDSNKIDKLRAKVVQHGWDYDKNFGNDSKNFFRKGITGEYKKELNTELLQKFEDYSKEMLIKYNYEV